MHDLSLDRAARFAAYLLGGAVLLAAGVPLIAEGFSEWYSLCGSSNTIGCPSGALGSMVALMISGGVLVTVSFVFFALGWQARHGAMSTRAGGALPPTP